MAQIHPDDLPTAGMAFGHLAGQCGKKLPLQVLQSNAGYYIGTQTENGPFSRESIEYFRKHGDAESALATGEWTQKLHP
jgi:hypothetical protein